MMRHFLNNRFCRMNLHLSTLHAWILARNPQLLFSEIGEHRAHSVRILFVYKFLCCLLVRTNFGFWLKAQTFVVHNVYPAAPGFNADFFVCSYHSIRGLEG